MRLAHVRERHAPIGTAWRLAAALDGEGRRWLDLETARATIGARDPQRAHNEVLFRQPVTTLDDHLGRLFEFMDRQGLARDTLVIFCADHGDFLGDHWLGEKELFYDTVQRVPFIVADPRPAADATSRPA